MKILILIARILLGLMFVVFGLNPFLNFIPAVLPPGPGGVFLGVLISSHYVYMVGLFQLIPGILLLINRFVPLALVLLAPMIVNIVTYHLTMEPSQAQLAILAVILWLLLVWRFRPYLAPLFIQKAETEPRARRA
jgi:uncharacterized membrane protein YphA (DoxX/SURF4 family)